MILQEKLKLWSDITGINSKPGENRYENNLDGQLSIHDIEEMNKCIEECLEYGETIFAETYLSIYFKKFLEDKTVSIMKLLDNKEVSNFVKNADKLYDAIKKTDAELSVMIEAKKVMKNFHLPYDELDALSVVDIRLSAIRCMENELQLRQFSYGSSMSEFKVSKYIYMFDTLDDLILWVAKGKIDGISLVYIRDKKKVSDSYFAFVINNGENLYILSDMPQYVNPVQKEIRISSPKNKGNRFKNNWFPYSFVDESNINESLEDSNKQSIMDSKKGTFSRIDGEMPYLPIGSIEHLSQKESFWFIVMTSLIKEKFYDNELPKLDISYTKSMINSPLLKKNKNILTVQKRFPHIELPVFSINDTENLIYKENSKKEFFYKYLVDRYADRVDTDLLNIIEDTEKAVAIENKYALLDYFDKRCGCEYHSLNLDTAGTCDEIVYRQKWIVRYNFAKSITLITKDEYENKGLELQRLIGSYIQPRISELVVMYLQNKLTRHPEKSKQFNNEYEDDEHFIGKICGFDKWYNFSESRGAYIYSYRGDNKSEMRCAFTHAKASVVLHISPKNADELAMVCGISKEKLPIELQHYNAELNNYYGNPILDNIDPFLWVINDEFNKMTFDVSILMSKAQYLKFCEETRVEPMQF